MTRFDKFIQIIFRNEGFLSDNKNDKGGLTKYGISKAAYPTIDIQNLTRQKAEQIYKKDYYDKCKIDEIENELLALHVFDFAVNAGIGRSIRILQKTIVVEVDGVIGKETIERANAADWSKSFIAARIKYYKQIATGRNIVFLNGWLNRVLNTTKAG